MFAQPEARLRSQALRTALSVLFFAALTALTARIAIPLPFTPVPVTLQVLAVLLAGLVLGSRAGALAQVAYLAAVASGLPFTAAGSGGPAAFVGPTAGYLLAFAPAAFVAGWIAERRAGAVVALLLAALTGVAVIYLVGAAWLSVWLGGDLTKAWRLGVAPFVLIDLLKAAAAAAVAGAGRRLLRLP